MKPQNPMETTSKHTPGPWHFDGKTVSAKGQPNVCRLENGHLIASAPDLLQVAKDFLLLAQLHDWEGAAIDFAKATLAKAEGRA